MKLKELTDKLDNLEYNYTDNGLYSLWMSRMKKISLDEIFEFYN